MNDWRLSKKAVPDKSPYPGVSVLSFCRFYIALLQVGLMSGAKIDHALSLTPSPTEPSERIQIDALIVALGMFVQVVCLDFLPYSDCKAQQSVGPQEASNCSDADLLLGCRF